MRDWSLNRLKEKLIKIGANDDSQGRYIVFQMAKSQSTCRSSRRFCHLSRNCGCCRHRHRHETSDLHASTATNGRSASECHAKWPPCMPAMLLGSREIATICPTSEFIRGIPSAKDRRGDRRGGAA